MHASGSSTLPYTWLEKQRVDSTAFFIDNNNYWKHSFGPFWLWSVSVCGIRGFSKSQPTENYSKTRDGSHGKSAGRTCICNASWDIYIALSFSLFYSFSPLTFFLCMCNARYSLRVATGRLAIDDWRSLRCSSWLGCIYGCFFS